MPEASRGCIVGRRARRRATLGRRCRAQSSPPSRRRGGENVTARTLTISRGWMMQVAPMPDKPPFMNGLTAFQVALSFRDMTMRSCGACGDVLRADLGADAFSFATERLSPEPAAAAISPSRLCATSFACGFFASLWRVEEKSGVSNPRVDIPRASRRRRDARAKGETRNLCASDFSGRKKITRRCSCDVRSIRRRVASDESGRALSTRVERIRARGHVARASERGAGRHAFARPRRAREATLDSVSE